MPIIKAPQYSKTINPKTGIQEPRYIFPIEFESNEELLSYVAEISTDIALQNLQKTVLGNLNWWTTFLQTFLQATIKLFSKPYTVENINKIAKHTLNPNTNTNTLSSNFPANVILIPKTIEISGGTFWVNWVYNLESVIIDIPDLEEVSENGTIEVTILPVSTKQATTDMEELNLDDLPVEGQSTDEILKIDSPTKFYDKQRVKEARLKAKLAVYKAHRQMAKYVEKYGNEVSDSDTEYESSDEDTEDEESEDEEVQL
jgi:hypothetical protein